MLKDIEIKHFRCFENTKISNFKRVNLIGGKNNAGKTALLEALLLNSSPRPRNIILLRRIRQESSDFSKQVPERTWNNFFFDQDREKTAVINSTDNRDIIRTVEISVDESIQDFFQEEELDNDDNSEVSPEKLMNLLSDSQSVRAILHLKSKTGDDLLFDCSLISSSQGIIAKNIKFPDHQEVFFIPSSFKVSSRVLATEYDKADLNGFADEVISAIEILDSSVINMQTRTIGEGSIYVKTQNGNSLPLSLFGDAVNRVTDIVLRLINNQNSILLVDEVENGIHHTSQRAIWQVLYQLSIDFNVQIFATTHSIEMIRAFAEAGLEFDEDIGAYFEMVKSPKTGLIKGINRDLETLQYAVERGKGVRGE